MNEFTAMIEDLLPEGWEIYDPEMGTDFLLLCPHSHVIEQDGRCPEGCISPMIRMGLI